MRWPPPFAVGLLLLVVAAPLVAGVDPASPTLSVCPAITDVAPYGPACTTSDGDVALFTAGGALLGLTHGVDPVLADDLPTVRPVSADGAFPRAPACVEDPVAPLEAHALVIYARAHDDADLYDAKADDIRDLVHAANGALHDAGVATGTAANIKVHCTASEVTVVEEVLETDQDAATFSTIMGELQLKGYTSPHVKYWVYYDDRGACSCGGVALYYGDDTAGPTNFNNGYAYFPQFAITFDYQSTRIMLHELGHTMGAVQDSAPHSTLAGHCTDGFDIMCYNDGGARGHLHSTDHCAGMPFDCGHDDYFHTNPAPGSYLAEHWNIGSRWNRFLVFEDNLAYGPV